MKKIIYLTIFVALFFSSCEDFLDTENYTKKTTANFPETVEDAEQMLTAIYNALNVATNDPANTYLFAAQMASDDCLGGGGDNDYIEKAFDKLLNYGVSATEAYWTAYYQGIYRANTAIETLDNCEGWTSVEQCNQFMGEAYFMRAYFYFELAQMYGQVPLVLETEPVNLPKAEVNELYGQIASDLKNAIELMYNQPYTAVESGHATKWAAQALMARVYLFYTGYYNQSSIALPEEEGGSISESQVISWLEDCINNSGHGLVSDYRNLWAYTNSATVEEYEYTKGQGLNWVEDGNQEAVFAIKYSVHASWSTNIGYGNQYCLYYGLRGGQDYEKTFPFGQGWGHGPVNPNLWNDWAAAEPNDMRREASIIHIPTELPDYTYGGWADFMEETDYAQKKYIAVTARGADGTVQPTFDIVYWGLATDNMQLDHLRDLTTIRFSDVLLMHSELTKTADGINRVRSRAGLSSVSYSLEALKNERRWELAFESVRWGDLRRWGDAAEQLARQEGVAIYNRRNPTTMQAFNGGYKARYEATGGFFKIPDSQVALSEGVLEQNPGWETVDSEFSGW